MTRDMTETQFMAALKRNGFRKAGLWAEHRDFPNYMFGLVYDYRKTRIARTASIAKHIRYVESQRARESA